MITRGVFKIPDKMKEKYRGAGYALAAVRDHQIVDIVYVSDIAPDCELDDQADVQRALTDPRIVFVINRLSLQGEVFAGMCSCWEFVIL